MAKITIASAPGRLDVMGGISDYSGALVLQMPLQETTQVELETMESDILLIESEMQEGQKLVFKSYWSNLQPIISKPEQFRSEIKKAKNGSWAIYPAGCLAAFCLQENLDLKGIRISISSKVPLGKGVSSSAAIEVATLKALAQHFSISFPGTSLARLAQKAENEYVGAPCGLMDQLASYHGDQGKILPILCQPDILFTPVSLPENLYFFGLDSGVKHAVTGASYGDVRTAAAMGYGLMAKQMSILAEELKQCRLKDNKSKMPFEGYLANVSPSIFEQNFAKFLPEEMKGNVFLEAFGETLDPLAHVIPEKSYALRQATWHPIAENQRTKQFRFMLENFSTEKEKVENQLELMGEWMYQSHASYSRCGLGHETTDWIVNQARAHRKNHIFGAKITGGGSGGTVCLMAWGEKGKESVHQLHQEAEQHFGKKLVLIDPNPS